MRKLRFMGAFGRSRPGYWVTVSLEDDKLTWHESDCRSGSILRASEIERIRVKRIPFITVGLVVTIVITAGFFYFLGTLQGAWFPPIVGVFYVLFLCLLGAPIRWTNGSRLEIYIMTHDRKKRIWHADPILLTRRTGSSPEAVAKAFSAWCKENGVENEISP